MRGGDKLVAILLFYTVIANDKYCTDKTKNQGICMGPDDPVQFLEHMAVLYKILGKA